jgi:2,4-dienoyl-CoA reductase-like NADH-dependent reductase (Old Yellow Enzyme family)
VLQEGRISPQDLGIWKDEHIAELQRIARFIKSQGAAPGIQLAHAGRKASTLRPWEGGGIASPGKGGWSDVFAPSPVPFAENYPHPVALDHSGIGAVASGFAEAASRALEAGFEVIEIHGAHGYLLHQFMSPLSNLRTDEYGGTFENRTRIVREVVTAIRGAWPESLPLFIRLSATDWVEGGWDIDQTVLLAKNLHPLGVDLVDCSSGGAVPGAKIPVGAGYQVPFAEAVKKAGVPSAAVGLITGAAQADEIVASGKADLVFLARQSLRDPYFPMHAAHELGAEHRWPAQYERAKP